MKCIPRSPRSGCTNSPQLSQVQRDFLEKARAFYEQFSQEEGNEPAVAARAGQGNLAAVPGFSSGSAILRMARPRFTNRSTILQKLVEEHPERPDLPGGPGAGVGDAGLALLRTKALESRPTTRTKRAVEPYEEAGDDRIRPTRLTVSPWRPIRPSSDFNISSAGVRRRTATRFRGSGLARPFAARPPRAIRPA